ncbi:hypothetical protein E3U43_010494 [Larimichthys crocea]|uniref:Uncharacterized protein n=1 Tax=Larimichthys crocea TaxID=215358 RepID=A0ACD3RFQ3_LARCR|nr:hypothetical protein E3U43_010494 [Larimichthys crocea]
MSAPKRLKKKRCEKRQVRVWRNFDEDRNSTERCQTLGLSSLIKLVPSISADTITTSPSFGSYKRREHICFPERKSRFIRLCLCAC